ncbi:MAG: hypothetical protein ACK5V3_05885, partial [Bdellovibrionales bacterium]
MKNPLFKLRLLTGFLWLLIYQALDNALTSFLEKLFRSSDGAPPWIWAFAVLSVILNMLAPLFISFWILTGRSALIPWKKFELLIIESLRAWGSTFLWGLALIVPGIFKWLSYVFVPFVAVLSKRYQEGEKEALQYSFQLFRLAWGKVTLSLIFFYILAPLLVALFFDGYRKIWETPLMSLLASS